MTTANTRPYFVPPSSFDLRLSAISRRVSASGPLAGVLTSLVYGDRERDHAEVLHHTTRARVADAVGARS